MLHCRLLLNAIIVAMLAIAVIADAAFAQGRSLLKTYPGYQTVFSGNSSQVSGQTAWLLAGVGSISENRFTALEIGTSKVVMRSGGRKSRVDITIAAPTALVGEDRIANFEDVVPIATTATEGLWQFFNTGGTYKRIVPNPRPDENNRSERCVQVDRNGLYGPHGLALKDGVLIDGNTKAIELVVYGDSLVDVGWTLNLKTSDQATKPQPNPESWAIVVTPGRWNRITIPLERWRGAQLNGLVVFPNAKNPSPATFYLDEVRWVR